jgi:hypothetical protein
MLDDADLPSGMMSESEEEGDAEQQGRGQPRGAQTSISVRDFAAYRLQYRSEESPHLLQGGRLTEEYMVDMYAKVRW